METIEIIEKAIDTKQVKSVEVLERINQGNRDDFKGFERRATKEGLYLALKLQKAKFELWLVFAKGWKNEDYLFVYDADKIKHIEKNTISKNKSHAPNYQGKHSFKTSFYNEKNNLSNEEKKDKFIKLYGSDVIELNYPSKVEEVDKFLEEVFFVGRCKILAKLPNLESEEIKNQEILENNETDTSLVEGKPKLVFSKKYERNKENRKRAIKLHGLTCFACGFNFEDFYGELGKDFIEIHHLKPLSFNDEEVEVNPKTDLIPLCPNCHRMIHKIDDYGNALKILKKNLKKPFK